MPARRNIFGAQYGTAKGKPGEARTNIPPPQTQAPVPLSLDGAEPMPMEGDPDLPPDLQQLLQQLLAQFGGTNGPAA